MRILVTGGAGFIGSHLVDKLIEMNYDVTVLDNLESQVHKETPNYLNSKAKYVFEDIRNKNILEKILKETEIIFHLASAVGVGQSMYEIEKYVEVNTMATSKLLDILVNKENNVKKLIVASSMSIYGEGSYKCETCGEVYPKLREENQLKNREWELKCPCCGKIVRPLPTNEDKPLHPTSIYAITKRDQEEMCLIVGKTYGIPTVALRYFNVYGPRQSLNNPYTGVCAIFSSRIKNNENPVIFEDGFQSRDFISVHDIVAANILAMKSSNANYKVFNVGTGKATTIKEIAELLIKLYNSNVKPEITDKYRAGDIRHCFADISRIKNIGFEPKISLEEGMKELVEWSKKIKAENKFDKAYEELDKKKLIK